MTGAHEAHGIPDPARHDPTDTTGATDAANTADAADEPVGSVGEEAAKLFEAVSEAWGARADRAEAGGEECRWCPVCRVAHHFHQTRPEVRQHLLSASRSLLAAAAALLEPGDGAEPDERPPPRTPRGTGARGVQHIDLDDDGPGGSSGPTGHERESQ